MMDIINFLIQKVLKNSIITEDRDITFCSGGHCDGTFMEAFRASQGNGSRDSGGSGAEAGGDGAGAANAEDAGRQGEGYRDVEADAHARGSVGKRAGVRGH